MARIAFAWELGGELGHAMACAALGQALATRGHECVYMLRELHRVSELEALRGATVFQAPVSPREGVGFGVPQSFADLLLGCGYADANDLAGLLAGWLALLRHARCDLLVADYAPTALLAARVLGIDRVSFNNGFATPPHRAPFPPFVIDAPVDMAALAAREAAALGSVNAVLHAHGAAALGALHEQLATREDFLCTLPELDHYGERPLARYWGPRFTLDAGDDVRWPYGEGPRVLVYLRRGMRHLDTLIELLVAHRCRVAAYIPGLDEARRARLQSAQRRVSARPMRLEPLLRECDLFVGHPGDVAVAALLHGVPQMVFPTQYEQLITAVRLEQAGAAIGLRDNAAPRDVDASFERMLRERARFAQAARAFRARYPAFSPQEQRRRIVARVEQLVARKDAP
jgi:hypothetical protein